MCTAPPKKMFHKNRRQGIDCISVFNEVRGFTSKNLDLSFPAIASDRYFVETDSSSSRAQGSEIYAASASVKQMERIYQST